MSQGPPIDNKIFLFGLPCHSVQLALLPEFTLKMIQESVLDGSFHYRLKPILKLFSVYFYKPKISEIRYKLSLA